MAYISFKPKDYYNTVTYTGNGSAGNGITGVGFQPDWVWIKRRESGSHNLVDVVRGVNVAVASESSGAQGTYSNNLSAFGTDGFTLGNGSLVNANAGTYVSYNWRAGNSQGSSNTDGSINTTYTSVNTTAGFSISKWTGTGSAGTIGHGLGAVPKFIIVKNVDSNNDWNVYHHKTGNEYRSFLNTTAAREDNASAWNDTSPTSSVFSIGTNTNVNQSGQSIIAYAFAEKKGYSKFGKYTGNGNDSGTFVYTGFKPAWIMAKGMNTSDNWTLWDSKRGLINVVKPMLRADATNVESNSGTYQVDILSNGFKWRSNDSKINQDGTDYIYMAFGQSLVGSNDTPCTAR